MDNGNFQTYAEAELKRRGIRIDITEPMATWGDDQFVCTLRTSPPITAVGDSREQAIERAFLRLLEQEPPSRLPLLAWVVLGLAVAVGVALCLAWLVSR